MIIDGLKREDMMLSSNGNIFRVTGPLWGESTGHRWIPFTKAIDVDVFFDLRRIKRLSKQLRDTGDLRYHRADYDVTVMGQAISRHGTDLVLPEHPVFIMLITRSILLWNIR